LARDAQAKLALIAAQIYPSVCLSVSLPVFFGWITQELMNGF